jgi:aspartate-semialdehyde dehydrogenase
MTAKLALIGSTGLVGQEFLKIWNSSENFGIKLDCVASYARPEQGIQSFEDLLKNISQYKYFVNAADSKQAEELESRMLSGQTLIDNSSAFRMVENVPLVVPEINSNLIKNSPKVIANPNCTAALLCMCLFPLKKWGLNRVVVSTYQAASGAGIKALNELQDQILQYAKSQHGCSNRA